MAESPQIFLAVSGASGSRYARRVLQRLLDDGIPVGLTLTRQGQTIATEELGPADDPVSLILGHPDPRVIWYANDDFTSPFATGSQPWRAMVVVPCSMGMVGRMAAGIAHDLITRAADVALKERRRLILTPRETPFSLVHLRNLTTLCEAGAVILPPSPGFYQHPSSIDDLVDFVVARIMAHL
jgi:4-hydroxy-3-polyprenylbenzoate decarboxylase